MRLDNEIIKGILYCNNNHQFKITKGIPRLVVSKIRQFIDTENAFSAKWNKFNKDFLDKSWYERDRKWFLNRYGWKNQSRLDKFLSDKRIILDAGTGIGNSAKLLAKNCVVFAIDASSSVDYAFDKFGKDNNIHFIQADLRQLPFGKNMFDYINSDQVLHHTIDAQSSFKYLIQYLKKSGYISFYVYKKKGPIREFSDGFIRNHTVKMDVKHCLDICRQITFFAKSLSNIKAKIKIEKDIPILRIKRGSYDLQRFIHWNFMKCYWSEDNDFQRSLGNNFDWYFPRLASHHTPQEVRSWCKVHNMKIINFQEIYSGISVLARKPNNVKRNLRINE